MASKTLKPVQKLGELLQEQQEPFMLEGYLRERGYPKKSLNSEGSFGCCHGNSSKFLKRSASCGLNKSRKGIPHCSKMLRAIYKKLAFTNERPKSKDSNNGGGKASVIDKRRNSKEVAESDRFSSASSTTVFNSCSESDEEEASTSLQKDQTSITVVTFQAVKLHNLREKEAATERKLRWKCMEDSKLLSPVSVLEEIPSHEGSPLHTQPNIRKRQEENPSTSSIILPKKITEDSILSASLWEVLLHSAVEDPGCAGVVELRKQVWSNPSSQYLKSKRVLQQTRQLLFDCVREVVETHERKERRQQHYTEVLGSEEIGRLICEKIKAWGKQSGDDTNITLQLELDFLDSAEEWSDFERERRDIGLAIGDAILEEIRNEIVTDLHD